MPKRKYKSFTYFLLIVTFFIVSSCNKRGSISETVKSKAINVINKKLIVPQNIYQYKPFTNYLKDSLQIANSKYKIYSLVDVSCATCIDNIKIWDNLAKEFDKHEVPIILICESHDNYKLFNHFCENEVLKKFPYPFFFDSKKEFVEKNKFTNENNHFKTMLTDYENNILLLGNPTVSKKINQMYLDEIQKRMN